MGTKIGFLKILKVFVFDGAFRICKKIIKLK